MDTAESYIKMCERARKIQDAWEMRPFDYYTMRYEHGYVNVRNIQGAGWFEKQRCGYIWLPCQDQLQEMIDWSCWQLSARFAEFAHIEAGQIPIRFTSMEQLWLAFVQKELHNEVWDKQEWGREQG